MTNDTYINDGDEDLDFQVWMDDMDEILDDACGFTHLDLPDWNYRDAFDAGRTPADCLDEILAHSATF